MSAIEELKIWGFPPKGQCYCGCGKTTKSYFHPGGDSVFAGKLLQYLRESSSLETKHEVEQAIRQLSENNSSEAA